MTSSLRTSNLTRIYGTVHALDGVDLDIPEGGIYGLVGPNGSGKTTALEILTGLRRATGGSIEYGFAQDAIAYCPDVAEFEPWLNAIETLQSSAGLVGKYPSREHILELLDRVGLASAATRQVGGFSRGMRSRMGLAAGLVTEPKLLIADEPAAALDPAGRREIIQLLAELGKSITVLVSSHDLADVERICDTIGVLAKGKLVYQGAISTLLERAAPALEVIVRPPADALLVGLQAAPWAHSVEEVEPGHFHIAIADAHRAEAGLPHLLAASNVHLVEVRRAGTSLQDIFFELTETGPASTSCRIAS